MCCAPTERRVSLLEARKTSDGTYPADPNAQPLSEWAANACPMSRSDPCRIFLSDRLLGPEIRPQVDWYDPQSEEVLLLTDAIQVKQQKARRGQGADKPALERATKRVHTEVWLVEQPIGGFTYESFQ